MNVWRVTWWPQLQCQSWVVGAGRRCEDGEVIVRLRIPPPVTSQPQSGDRLTLPPFTHTLTLPYIVQ